MGKESAYSARDTGLIPGSQRSLEEETATHSSILAWKIPWTEEPGRLPSMMLQRVRMTEHMALVIDFLVTKHPKI